VTISEIDRQDEHLRAFTRNTIGMSKTFHIELHQDSYKSFFDHEWFEQRTEETRRTPLYQPVFDLGAAWRFAANTHALPWLLATMVQGATEMNLNTTEPFGKKYVADVRDVLLGRMGDSLRNMQRKRMQQELDAIYEETSKITVAAEAAAPDMMWQNFLGNSEFRFTEDIIFVLHALLVEKSASNFRNQLAHGMLEYGAFFSDTALYIWWLVLHLCALGAPRAGAEATTDKTCEEGTE
jgi:hypothetical protein